MGHHVENPKVRKYPKPKIFLLSSACTCAIIPYTVVLAVYAVMSVIVIITNYCMLVNIKN
jgi:hypothetical protein